MYSIGIDLGGTNIAAGLVDDDYKIILKKSVPTRAEREADAISADIASLCLALIEEKGLGKSDISFIGIATPGTANDRDGIVEYANNLPFLRYPIAERVSKMSGIERVYIANDANAAALGEAMAGAAKGTHSSIMVTLGTGVGGGIIIDGKVYSGFNNAAGELGHTVIEYNGRICSCGRRGCWETYSSATGLIKTTKEKIKECHAKNIDTVMFEDEARGHINGRTAFNGMRAGDVAATEVVKTYIDYLACGIANMINIFQPEVLTIGGGISNEKDFLLDLLLLSVNSDQYSRSLKVKTEIKIAELGNDAGIVGAASLGR
jgi:glucokinase